MMQSIWACFEIDCVSRNFTYTQYHQMATAPDKLSAPISMDAYLELKVWYHNELVKFWNSKFGIPMNWLDQ